MNELNVLIIDDSITFVNRLVDLLKKTNIKSLSTDFIGNCSAALKQFTQKKYNLILIDPHLPDANFKEVLTKIRNINANITIVVITNDYTASEFKTFEQYGVVTVIRKSEISEFVLKHIIQIISNYSETQQSYLQCIREQKRLEIALEAKKCLKQWLSEPFSQAINVLIVNDSVEKLKSLEMILVDTGCHILKAKNSAEMLKKLKKHDHVALIIMDVQMPKKDGLDTAELIRQNKEYKNLPIIFISEKEWDDTMIMKAYALKASDYLLTPLQPVILKAKVKVFLSLYQYQQEKLIWSAQKVTKDEMDMIIQEQHKMMIWAEEEKIFYNSKNKSLRQRNSELFDHFLFDYELLLDAKEKNIEVIHKRVKILAECLGRQDAGASDIVDIHLSAIFKLTKGNNIKQSIAYTLNGRSLAIKLMGNLLEYYHQ